MRIAFIDPIGTAPYHPGDLTACPLGGTEASILILADALSRRGHAVSIHRDGPRLLDGAVAMRPLTDPPPPEAVVVVRDDPAAALSHAAGRQAQGRVWLWRHDFAKHQAADLARLTGRVPIVAVSHHLAGSLRADLPGAQVTAIWNPVVIHDPGPVDLDRHRLVFAASPHKHRWQALNLFADLRARIPGLRLTIAHPGYHPQGEIWGEGVEMAGALTRPDLHRLLKSSLALFHATDFAESFGLLLAEAQALGTPVLVPPVGAAPEVVTDPRQCAPLDDPDAVAATVSAWIAGTRPRPAADARFLPDRIAAAWDALLATR